mgnify:CR=1 FL=1
MKRKTVTKESHRYIVLPLTPGYAVVDTFSVKVFKECKSDTEAKTLCASMNGVK